MDYTNNEVETGREAMRKSYVIVGFSRKHDSDVHPQAFRGWRIPSAVSRWRPMNINLYEGSNLTDYRSAQCSLNWNIGPCLQ